MQANPKVSICIPSYNHARFLPDAIESALGQTYPHIEVLIVDDGSTDDSLAIAESYALKNPSVVRVFTHPGHRNLGISATVNEGFKRSTGAYFMGLPSDDMMLPEKVERQVVFLESHLEIGWVYCYAHFIDEQGNLMPGLFGWDISQESSPVEKLIVMNSIPGMTVLARRECFEAVGPHTENLIYSDWEFWIRMAARYKPGFIDSPMVKYRLHTYNTSVGIDDQENFKRGLEVLNSVGRNAPAYGAELTEPRIQVLIDLQRARYLYCLGQSEAAATSLDSGLETYFMIQDRLRLLDEWLASPHPHPEYFQEFIGWMIERLRAIPGNSLRKAITRRLEGLTFARAALKSYQAGDLPSARRMAIQAQRADSRWLTDRPLLSILAESVVGSPIMTRARKFKHWIATTRGQTTSDE